MSPEYNEQHRTFVIPNAKLHHQSCGLQNRAGCSLDCHPRWCPRERRGVQRHRMYLSTETMLGSHLDADTCDEMLQCDGLANVCNEIDNGVKRASDIATHLYLRGRTAFGHTVLQSSVKDIPTFDRQWTLFLLMQGRTSGGIRRLDSHPLAAEDQKQRQRVDSRSTEK